MRTLAALLLLASAAVCLGDVGMVMVSEGPEMCMLYDPGWAALPTSWAAAPALLLAFVDPPLGCTTADAMNITNGPALAGRAAVFARGLCTFSLKMEGARKYGAAAVIVVDSWGTDMIAPGPANASDYDAGSAVAMVMVAPEDGDVLRSLPPSATVRLTASPAPPRGDPNIVLFVLIASSCMVLGSLWAHTRNRFLIHGTSALLWPSTGGAPSNQPAASEDETLRITPRTILIFVAVSCSMLLALYFLYSYLYYVVLAIFCLVSTIATHRVLDLLFVCLPFSLPPFPISIPYWGPVTFWSLLSLALAISLSSSWAVYRNAEHAWVAQDILGICFLTSTIQFIRLPSLKLASILLCAFLLYDVFFVFITPLLTTNHDSVMVTAATGGSGGHGQVLPLIIAIPRLNLPSCLSGMSMLGFGDVIMPSLLVSFCRAVDLALRPPRPPRAPYLTSFLTTFLTRNAYFAAAACAYVFGLLMTYVALIASSMAQPALLYLVPCTLGATWFVGWRRGQLRALLDGSILHSDDNPPPPSAPGALDPDGSSGDIQAQPLLDDKS